SFLLLLQEAGLMEIETIRLKSQKYVTVERTIINYGPRPGEVFAELVVKKPNGYITYAVDEIYERREPMNTGLAFLDAGDNSRPIYSYKLRPDRELPQGNVERKFLEKSPCCNRTMNYLNQGSFKPKRICRKCGKEVPYT